MDTAKGLQVGSTTGQYRIDQDLGTGGFGTVWKASNQTTQVAIKEHIKTDSGDPNATWFQHEVDAHRNISQAPSPPRIPKFIESITDQVRPASADFLILLGPHSSVCDGVYSRGNS